MIVLINFQLSQKEVILQFVEYLENTILVLEDLILLVDLVFLVDLFHLIDVIVHFVQFDQFEYLMCLNDLNYFVNQPSSLGFLRHADNFSIDSSEISPISAATSTNV